MCNIYRKRARTVIEQVESHLLKYQLLPACSGSCRKKCADKLTEEQRQHINHTYWSLSFGERRSWLDGYINILNVERRRGDTTESDMKRSKSLWYTLPQSDGRKVTVCKQMFLHTLGLKTDGMITEFIRAKKLSLPSSHESSSKSITHDNRGHREPPNKVDESSIRSHINSYHPAVSHYQLEHTPYRRYLEPHLTVRGICC